MNRIIFGCGYLGNRVADIWAAQGDSVFALTRNPDRCRQLSDRGITPIVGDITDPNSLSDLPTVDSVLFAVGMDRTKYSDIRDVYVHGLKNVMDRLPADLKEFIYISSTGVYGNFDGAWVDESSTTEPTREGGKACLEAEQLIRNSSIGPVATVLRFAGIYGPGRVPTRKIIESRQWDKLSAEGYVNLIHVEDGARIIDLVSKQKHLNETILVSDGNPAIRKQYYEFIAGHFGFTEIPWAEGTGSLASSRAAANKRISNSKLLALTDYQFEFPDYQSGLTQAFASD